MTRGRGGTPPRPHPDGKRDGRCIEGGRPIEDFAFALSSLVVVLGPWKVAIVFAELTSALPVATRRLVAFGTVATSLAIAVFLVLVFAIRMMLAERPPRPPGQIVSAARARTAQGAPPR